MKTSAQWLEQVQARFPQFQITKPLGWDGKNYDYSFNEELISGPDFYERLFHSNVIASNEMWRWISAEMNQHEKTRD